MGNKNKVLLKDICNVITKGTTPSQFSEKGINFIRIENINGLNIDSNFDMFISEKIHVTDLKRSILKKNDILFAIAGATVGKCAIVNEDCLPANTNQALAIIRLKNNYDSFYIANILASEKMKKYIYLNISVGAQPNLSLEQIGNFQFYVDDIVTQTKIATFLNLYYKKIELQKKKIDLLRNMFKWVAKINLDINKEEMYIENLVEEFIEKSHTENQYPVLSSTMNGIFLQNEYFTDNVITQSNIGYKIVPYNYFTYRSMSDTGKFVFNVQRLVDKGIVSPAYPVFNVNEKCISDFLYYYLNYSKYIKKQLLLLKEGGTRYALGFEKFKKLKVVCLTLEEQQVIVENLDILKSKLELEKQKLETMEKYKQGLLQQLFI